MQRTPAVGVDLNVQQSSTIVGHEGTFGRVRGAGTGMEPSPWDMIAADPCNGFQPG